MGQFSQALILDPKLRTILIPEMQCSRWYSLHKQPGCWVEVEPLVNEGSETVLWGSRLGFGTHGGHVEPGSPQGHTVTLAVAATGSQK